MPALVTPFTQGGSLDLRAHTHNLRVLSERDIEGFVIGGSNGEGPYLEPGERGRLIKAGRRRKTHFMAGIAAETTRMAKDQLDEVSEAGADSVLVLTPTTLARGRDEAILRFYRELADRARVPLYLYSVPMVTAYNLPIATIAKLAQHPNIEGMKDSSGDVARIQAIIETTPGDFIVYSGSSKTVHVAKTIGCHGLITGSGNYVPELVMDTMREEDTTKGRKLQKRLNAITTEVEAHGVPGVKAAARAAGLRPGYPRSPLARLSRGAETSIAKLIPS